MALLTNSIMDASDLTRVENWLPPASHPPTASKMRSLGLASFNAPSRRYLQNGKRILEVMLNHSFVLSKISKFSFMSVTKYEPNSVYQMCKE